MTQAYPLHWPDGWARTPVSRRIYNSRFKTTFTKARADLFAELDRLSASNAVVSSWLPLRNDGLPRADAARQRVTDPGDDIIGLAIAFFALCLVIFAFKGSPDVRDAIICNLMQTCDKFVSEK